MKAVKIERGMYQVGSLIVRRVEPRKLWRNRNTRGLVAQYWVDVSRPQMPIAYTLAEVKEIAASRAARAEAAR